MPVYIAMLRGINVSGQKIVKMDALRTSFEALGFGNVRTYVQSGNVVFHAPKASEAGLVAKIAKQILADFGYDVSVLIRTPAELEAILKGNPFAKRAGNDESRLYVTFLSSPAPRGAGDLLQPLATASEQIAVDGRAVYLQCPNGYGTTKVSNTAIEKKLSLSATTRNWRTVNALVELAQA